MKKILTILLLMSAVLCNTHAQNSFNCADIDIRNADMAACLPCAEHGFCLLRTYRSDTKTSVKVSVYDTMMQRKSDTAISVDGLFTVEKFTCENNRLTILLNSKQGRKLNSRLLMNINLENNVFFSKPLPGFEDVQKIENLHQIGGNIVFSTSGKRTREQLWFLPEQAAEPVLFEFTKDIFADILYIFADSDSRNFIVCIAADNKTFVFQTEVDGKSVFASTRNVKSDGAHIEKMAEDHYFLILSELTDDYLCVGYSEVKNKTLLNRGWGLYFYLRGNHSGNPLDLNETETAAKVLSSIPENSRFSPLKHFRNGNMLAVVTDVLTPEYHQYHNGYFYDSRFYGYRYENSKILIHDMNGEGYFARGRYFEFPYDDSHNLHQTVMTKARVAFLPDGNILIYYMDNDGFTTQLLDSGFNVVDPVRTQEIPLRSNIFRKRNAEVEIFEPWYGGNNFILGATQFDDRGRAVGYIVNKLKFD